MHRKDGRHAWELAHKSMHYGLTVYGDAVHEEVARKGGFRMSAWRNRMENLKLQNV